MAIPDKFYIDWARYQIERYKGFSPIEDYFAVAYDKPPFPVDRKVRFKQTRQSQFDRLSRTVLEEARLAGVEVEAWYSETKRRQHIVFAYDGQVVEKIYYDTDLYSDDPDEILADLLGTILDVQGK